MKIKYKRLNRVERKKAIEDFKNFSQAYKVAIKKLNNMQFLAGFGIIFGIFSFIFDLSTEAKIIHFAIDGSLIIFCFFAFIKAYDLKITQVNKFIIDKEKLKK